MNIEANTYNDSNKPQINDANQLISTLLKINPKKKYDVILDIGCGSGNVTKILSERIQHNRIVALDADPGMVKFAQTNFASNSIEYLTQDISQSWDELSFTLKELEGKVSLIFSNRVLHWVKDKETAAINMSKLLAEGGDVCINITALPDIKPYLNDELKGEFNYIPSIDEQFELWRKLLTDNGINLSFAEILQLKTFYQADILPAIWWGSAHVYKIYIKNQDPDNLKEISKNSNLNIAVLKSSLLGLGEDINVNSYEGFLNHYQSGVGINYKQFRYVGKKE